MAAELRQSANPAACAPRSNDALWAGWSSGLEQAAMGDAELPSAARVTCSHNFAQPSTTSPGAVSGNAEDKRVQLPQWER